MVIRQRVYYYFMHRTLHGASQAVAFASSFLAFLGEEAPCERVHQRLVGVVPNMEKGIVRDEDEKKKYDAPSSPSWVPSSSSWERPSLRSPGSGGCGG